MGTSFVRLLTVALIACLTAVQADSQGVRSAQVEIFVTDSHGRLLTTEANITIATSGAGSRRLMKVRGKGALELPVGSYRMSAVGVEGVADRTIQVWQERAQVILALSGRPQDDDQPWTIRGRVAPLPAGGEVVIVRLVGVYADRSTEAVVGPDGAFVVKAWAMGPYKLWLLRSGKRVAERDIEIEPLPKELPLVRLEAGEPR